MPLHVVARGALIGGGVGLVLAAARRPASGEAEPDRAGRFLKSIAEGALAGATVGFFLDRSLRRRAAELAVEAYGVARPIVLEAYEQARPRVEEAVDVVRAKALELRASA